MKTVFHKRSDCINLLFSLFHPFTFGLVCYSQLKQQKEKGENMRRKGLTAAETVVHIYSNYSLKTAGCMNNLTWHPFSPTPLPFYYSLFELTCSV